MVDFAKIDEARKILGLGEEATKEEIKKAFRLLALKYHPDRCKDKEKKKCEEIFKKIKKAKDIIDDYCEKYRFSFKEKEVRKSSMAMEEYEHIKRFYDEWFI